MKSRLERCCEVQDTRFGNTLHASKESSLNNNDDLARAIRDFGIIATKSLQGRGLSVEQAIYYQAHPEEWHRRMFGILMTFLSETRTLYNMVIEMMLRNATKVPASKLSEALKFTDIFGPDLEKISDCWEVDKDFAYERFGIQFEFPPPPFMNEKRSVESDPAYG